MGVSKALPVIYFVCGKAVVKDSSPVILVLCHNIQICDVTICLQCPVCSVKIRFCDISNKLLHFFSNDKPCFITLP